jgi:hypothetical protein
VLAQQYTHRSRDERGGRFKCWVGDRIKGLCYEINIFFEGL